MTPSPAVRRAVCASLDRIRAERRHDAQSTQEAVQFELIARAALAVDEFDEYQATLSRACQDEAALQ